MAISHVQADSGRQNQRYTLHGNGKIYPLTEAQFKAARIAVNTVKRQDNDRTLTTGEAAVLLGVSAKTVARILDAGKIPFLRLSPKGHRMVRRADVLDYRHQREERRHLLIQASDMAHEMGADDAEQTS